MTQKLTQIEGIGAEFQKKFARIGIKTLPEFLASSQTQEQRDQLSRRTGIGIGYIDNWATMLDLSRVEGIGFQFAELLTYSGVKSVDDFRKRNPHYLHETMKEVNDQKHFTHVVPSEQMLSEYIQKSKQITNIVDRH